VKRLTLAILLVLTVASPANARPKTFIEVDQDQIIIGGWVTVTYSGSDYARFACTQGGVEVWTELAYLPGEGGPRQISPVLPYRAGTYTNCTVDLVIPKHRERTIASDAFVVYSPV
jgi:hypothetical protein